MVLFLKWVFWVSIGLGVYVYFIYPAILALLAALIRRTPPRESDRVQDLPITALLIACYNEEKEVQKRLENALALDYPHDRFRILVLSDGSEDRTIELARDLAEVTPDRTIEILDFPDNRGKSATLLRGVTWLKEHWPDVEILAFTDANTHWAVDALTKLVAPFADREVGSVSGLLRYIIPEGSGAGNMEDLYWQYEAHIKRLCSRLGTLPGACGSIYTMRINAYEPLTESRGDDFELPVQAMLNGYRSILVEDAKAFEPPSPDFLTEYRRKLRITGQMIPSAVMLFGRAIARRRILIAFQLLSHKLLRYLVPFYQILLLASSGLMWDVALFYRITFLIQIVFYALAGLGFILERSGSKPAKLLHIPLYFTMVNFASLVSIFRVAAGRKVHWERNR